MTKKSTISAPLSERENTVLNLAAQGFTDKEISRRLNCQISTIRTYWERIRQKLDANNRAHAVAVGQQRNQIERASIELGAFVLHRIETVAIFMCDAAGHARTWNAGVEKIIGYTQEEWIGQHQAIMFIPEEKDEAQQELEDARLAGASVNDRWHVRKDGTRFWGTNTVIKIDPAQENAAYAKIVHVLPEPTK